MRYIVVPAEVLKQVPAEVLNEMGLDPRYNSEGTEAVMHVDHYEQLFPLAMTLGLTEDPTEPVYPFPVYEAPSGELDALLSSPGWEGEEHE